MDVPPPSSQRLVHLVQFQQKVNRRHWYWLIIGYLVYALLAAVGMLAFRNQPSYIPFALNLVLILGIVLIMRSLSVWRFNHLMNKVQHAERERVTVEMMTHQFEAVQATARAVAHNMNQPLAAALGYLELYETTPIIDRDEKDLVRVQHEIRRIAALVRQLQQVTIFHTVPYAGGVDMLDLASTKPITTARER